MLATPNETKVIGTTRLGTNSERNAAAQRLIVDNNGMAKAFFIRIASVKYIILGIIVGLQVRKVPVP